MLFQGPPGADGAPGVPGQKVGVLCLLNHKIELLNIIYKILTIITLLIKCKDKL